MNNDRRIILNDVEFLHDLYGDLEVSIFNEIARILDPKEVKQLQEFLNKHFPNK